MKVIVTGGSGRVGQAVVRALLERGDSVVALDINPPQERFPFLPVDVTDFSGVIQALDGADAVVHLAAIPGPQLAVATEVFRVNVLGTYHVLEACRVLGIQRVVMASSINAVGLSYNRGKPRLDYLPLDENHPARPEDPYSLSKWLGEQIGEAMARLEPQMTLISLRFHGIVPPEWHERIRTNPPKELPGNFKGLWGYVDIRDVVDAILKSLDASFTGHEAFFICARDTTIALPTMEVVKAIYPDVPLKRELPGFTGLFDVDKASKLLGWRPRHSWRTGG